VGGSLRVSPELACRNLECVADKRATVSRAATLRPWRGELCRVCARERQARAPKRLRGVLPSISIEIRREKNARIVLTISIVSDGVCRAGGPRWRVHPPEEISGVEFVSASSQRGLSCGQLPARDGIEWHRRKTKLPPQSVMRHIGRAVFPARTFEAQRNRENNPCQHDTDPRRTQRPNPAATPTAAVIQMLAAVVSPPRKIRPAVVQFR
jgi:hypothetical protein